MAERTSQAKLITLRDNLLTAYTNISTSATSSYTLGDRTFTYANRADLWKEIQTIETQILARSTTYKAYGKNRVNFESWN
tara:strand:+ start:3916 stop:4155 length:240 start_codon:yes stop_codon:yes gene_type:complete